MNKITLLGTIDNCDTNNTNDKTGDWHEIVINGVVVGGYRIKK